MYRSVVSAINHPDPLSPHVGLFNARSFEALVDQGVSLEVVAPRPHAPPVGPYSEYRGIPEQYDFSAYTVRYPRFTYLLPRRLFKFTISSLSFRRVISNYLEEHVDPPDICHAGHIHFDGYGLIPYCKKHDIPLTVMGRGKLLNQYPTLSRISQQQIRETLTFADHVLCVSQSLAERARMIAPETTVSVLANGVHPHEYPFRQRAEIREELGIAPETTMVLFCGGFTERKGIREIIAGIDDIQSAGVKLVFVGHYGKLRNELIQTLATSSHTNYEVHWKLSPVALRRLFTASDIFLLPSHAEGRPNTIYEAMASRTAVVASAVSGIPEQIIDGKTGILLTPGDVTDLTDSLNDLINAPSRQTRMGAAGFQRLLDEGWTWERHGKELSTVHKNIIERD